MSELKLGVIGMSDGNGHPYSWAAICNGYDPAAMANCPFPVIPQYLAKETWPEAKIPNVRVTHVWTQDKLISEDIAKASLVEHVSDNLEDMIGEVDAVLMARDDAENHLKHAKPFIEAGLPIYIDKPFALNVEQAKAQWALEVFEDQIFTCSSFQFSREFMLDEEQKKKVGEPKFVWASIPKSWSKYGVHVIEPVLKMFPQRGCLFNVKSYKDSKCDVQNVIVEWTSGLVANFTVTSSFPSPVWIRVLGNLGHQDLYLKDSFGAFKSALEQFVGVVNKQRPNIDKKLTLEMVEILESGIEK